MREVLRNERKFLLDAVRSARKIHQLRPLLHEDINNGPEGYMVRSLYFDTGDDGDLFDKAHGINVRRKLRLRIYDTSGDSAMLGLKQKQGVQQKKRSLRLRREEAERLCHGDYSPLLSYNDPFAAECYGLMHRRCYQPRVINQYSRLAFVVPENSTRITFDRYVTATQSSFDLFDPKLLLTPVLDPSAVVLEVKFNGFLLTYVKELLRGVEESELAVSKYVLARQLTAFASL